MYQSRTYNQTNKELELAKKGHVDRLASDASGATVSHKKSVKAKDVMLHCPKGLGHVSTL